MATFRPDNPQAVHERFERVKARTLKRLDHEEREMRTRLRQIDDTGGRSRKARRPVTPRHAA
jgi:hypothetical protein